MAGANVSGNRGLNFTASLRIHEAQRNAETLKKSLKELAALAANSSAAGGSAPNSAPITAYRQAQLQMQEALRNSRLETERLKQEQIQLKNALQQGKVTQQDFRNETARLRAEQATLTAATRQARVSQTAASGSYREAQTRLRELGMEIRNTTGGLSGMGVVQQARIREYNELNSSLKRFDATLGNHQRNVGNYPTILNGVTSGLIGLTAGFTSAAAILTSSFDTALKTDSIKTALEFTFGSVDIAAQKLDMLRKMANRLGIDYIALADSYRSFAGAAVASNYPLKEAERVFNAVSNAGAKLRLTSDQVKGALLALQQMISKGNVQAEELRGQLGERLPGAFSIAARAMGVSEVELNKMLKAGTVLASDLLPKLATELDKTFGNDQTQKIDALSSSWSRLKNSFSEIVEEQGAVSGFFNLIITLAGYAAAEIAGMSKALGTMFQLVTNGKGFLTNSTKQARAAGFTAIQEKAGKDAKSVVGSSKSQSALIKAINEEVAAGIEAQKVYTEAEKNYQNTREKNRTLSLTKDLQSKKATLDYQREFVSSLKAIYKEQFQPDVIKEISDAELKSVKAIQKRINDLKKLDGSADVGSEVYSRIEKLQERLAKPKKQTKLDIDTELNAQRSLQAKIDELTKKGVAKELDADEQELESVKRKYAKMREEAVRFNNDPANKKRGLRVDSGGLLRAEDNELQSIRAKQETKVLETELDFRKKLYQEYEDFRDRLGKDEADKRFASELKGERSYLEHLQRIEDEILNRKQGKGADSDGGDLSAIDKARLVEIQKRIKEEKVLEDKKNADLYISAYQAAKTHAQAMLAIEEEYQRNIDALRKAGSLSAEQQAVLDKNKARALSEASVKELMDSDAWSNLFSNLDERTAKEIEVLLKQIEKQFSTLSVKFDPIDIETVRAKLNTAREILIRDNPFKQVGISIKEIFNKGADDAEKSTSEIKTDWKNLGQATEASFKFVEDAIASADFLKEAIGDVGATAISSLATVAAVSITVAAAIKTAEKASVILAIVQAALVVVQAIASVLGSIFARHDKKIEKSIQKHEDEVKRLGRAYNQLERDIQNAVGQQIEQAQKKQLDNIKMQQAELAKARDAEMSKKKKDQDKIDEYNEQIAQLGQNAIDVQNAINEALTGTTSKSIAESIIAGFKEGKRSAADFADTFKDMMTDAMYKAMSAQFLDEAIAGFYKKFISVSEGGLSESELTGLQREWNNIIEKGSVIADNIDKVTGGVAGGSASPNSMQGAYATASQESITLLAGQTSGMRIAQLQTNTILTGIGKTIGDFFNMARDNFNTMLKIEANTGRTAANTEPIAEIRDEIRALNRKIDNNANAAKAAGF